jgi:hypothetical protein
MKPFLTFLIAALLLAPVARAQEPPAEDDGEVRSGAALEITPRTEKAIKRGLDYLAKHQHPDGYWVEAIGRKVNEEYQGYPGKHVGVTALACISFIANGSTPGRGPYGDNVKRGLDWLLEQVREDGFITLSDSRMYEHSFATLFLAEVYGMSPDEHIRPKLQAAVDCIVQGQNAQGGWRYLPGAKDSDMSITVTCVMALRAARNVGIYVPRETIQRAIDYVKLSYVPDSYPNPEYRGGFWYQIFDQPFRHSRTSFALTAAGVTALYGAGEYDSPQVREGLKFLFFKTRWKPPAWRMHQSFDYFYGHYYAIQAFYQAGGEYWAQWYPAIRDEIVSGQRPGGYWEDFVGRNYSTAMATIILQIPYRYLPIFER